MAAEARADAAGLELPKLQAKMEDLAEAADRLREAKTVEKRNARAAKAAAASVAAPPPGVPPAGLLLSYEYIERLHFGGFHRAIVHVSHRGT